MKGRQSSDIMAVSHMGFPTTGVCQKIPGLYKYVNFALLYLQNQKHYAIQYEQVSVLNLFNNKHVADQ